MNPQYFSFFKKASSCISNEYTKWDEEIGEYLDGEINFDSPSAFLKSLAGYKTKEEVHITPKLKKD